MTPARRPRAQWLRLPYIMTAALALYGLFTFGAYVVDSHRMITELYRSSQADRAQLVSAGLSPVGRPPEQIIGEEGPPGSPGPSGPTGATGARGATGPPGSPGKTGPAGPSGPSGPPGPSGPAGADGVTGPQGPAGLRGEAGPSGPAGADGADGAAGAPPAMWTWVDPSSGVRYQCARDPESPAAAPAYTCVAL